MDELLKKIKELGGDELATQVQTEITKRNEEAGDQRKKKSDLSKLVTEIMGTIGVDKKEDVIGKVTGTSNEMKMLIDKVAKLEETNITTTEKAKKVDFENQISSVLIKKNIKKKFDFTKQALLGMVEEGKTGLLVGDKSLEDYVQSLIDEDPTVVESKKKKETHKSTGDFYTEVELGNLTEAEVEKNMDKVNNSLAALETEN